MVWRGEQGGGGGEVAVAGIMGAPLWFWVRRSVGLLRVVAGRRWVGVTTHQSPEPEDGGGAISQLHRSYYPSIHYFSCLKATVLLILILMHQVARCRCAY